MYYYFHCLTALELKPQTDMGKRNRRQGQLGKYHWAGRPHIICMWLGWFTYFVIANKNVKWQLFTNMLTVTSKCYSLQFSPSLPDLTQYTNVERYRRGGKGGGGKKKPRSLSLFFLILLFFFIVCFFWMLWESN